MSTQPVKVDVAVIGGGLAGLTAARLLSQRRQSTVLLEARGRLGGRLESQRFTDGTVVDLGGQWHGPGQDRLVALGEELGLRTHPTSTRGRKSYEFRAARGRYAGALPLRLLPGFVGALVAGSGLARLGRQCERARASGKAQSVAVDTQTLGDWVRRSVWPSSAQQLLRFMLQSLFCCNIDEVSLLLAATCVARCGSLDHMLGIENGAQELQFTEGSECLVRRLAEHVPHVLLQSPVERIAHDEQGATLWGPDFCVFARRVVIAIPPQLVSRIAFEPGLSAARTAWLQNVRMGSVLKSVAVYDTPFWRKAGLSGETWSVTGPLNGTYDTSNPAVPRGILTALSSGASATLLQGMTPQARKLTVLGEIAQHLGPSALTPLHYAERLWNAEQFTGGGYTVYVAAGSYDGMQAFRTPEGVLHWAGTETATSWPGYMEGALQSGQRVADEIAAPA